MYMHPVVLCLQDQLGEVVYVQLPEIDTELELGRKFLKKKIHDKHMFMITCLFSHL